MCLKDFPFLQIDEDILQEVIKMGFDKNQLVESLHSRIQNEVFHITLLIEFIIFRSCGWVNASFSLAFVGLQLYKTREDKYLLDLQRVSGPHLLFLDLCAAFLAQLRVL
ncbi:hypothetical protein BHE74_00026239 [Ensete ventricosum]|nr:hypothetical protein GW17_00042988 [Ensete ventricosum]RWW66400.1 hypothetical protein BHE74_00026239 [Ensete ventricosum]